MIVHLTILLASITVLMSNGQVQQESVPKQRIAIVLTLAGGAKLSDYFDWTCMSIASSANLVDMLVFHEANAEVLKRERQGICAENVKFIDLGYRGLVASVVSLVMNSDMSLQLSDKKASSDQLVITLSEVVANIPKYLVEVKPVLGELFHSYLSNYTHWTYSDPDILWGDLSSWIEPTDLDRFDILSVGKQMDSGRLFLRGQMTVHKNIDRVNTLWRELTYLKFKFFLTRIGSALQAIKTKSKESEKIFEENFFSAEGLYSAIVLDKKRSPSVSVKIVGRAFDDFSQLPTVLSRGKLFRCSEYKISLCLEEMRLNDEREVKSYHALPAPKYISADAQFLDKTCRMQWLPVDARQCIASEIFTAKAGEDSHRLERVGESVFENGRWYINDEQTARRNFVNTHGAYFHFRHWYDIVRRGIVTVPLSRGDDDCMVLRIRADNTLAYESCESALEFDKIAWKGTEQFKAALREKAVASMLSKIRRVKESGKEVKSRQESKKNSPFKSPEEEILVKHRNKRNGGSEPTEEDRLMHRLALRGQPI